MIDDTEDDKRHSLMKIWMASYYSGISAPTIRKWIRQGKIPVYGRGRIYRVCLADVLPRREADLPQNNPKYAKRAKERPVDDKQIGSSHAGAPEENR
jgi:excisionase family DNA binding protein